MAQPDQPVQMALRASADPLVQQAPSAQRVHSDLLVQMALLAQLEPLAQRDRLEREDLLVQLVHKVQLVPPAPRLRDLLDLKDQPDLLMDLRDRLVQLVQQVLLEQQVRLVCVEQQVLRVLQAPLPQFPDQLEPLDLLANRVRSAQPDRKVKLDLLVPK